MAVKLGARNTIRSGPWSGVVNTPDPFDGGPDKLLDARNTYIPAPDDKADVFERPGFTVLNGGAPVYASATAFKGQGTWTHYDLNGTPYNFAAFGGHLFLEDSSTGLFTDVTPSGVTIDGSTETRVYFASMGGVMMVTDGVNRPWVASDLASVPITGTYIDFDSNGTAWNTFGVPVVFGGSGFVILRSYNGVAARLSIAWSETNDWTTGWQQTDFDNVWTLEQTGTTPITGLAATNVALYYWRQRSIGSISGTVGPDLASTATHDVITTNVGTEAPQTIVQFGDTIFFCDVIGRPWSFTLGSAPTPIWQQLRGIVDVSSTAFAGITAIVATASFEPTLNLYCVAIWSPVPSNEASPVVFQTFDAQTGNYLGQWSIGPNVDGVSIDCLGSFIDDQGRGTLVVLGSLVTGGATGYAWSMSDLVGVPDFLTTADATPVFLTTADTPPIFLTTAGQGAIWMDNGDVPLVYAQTDRLGYSEDVVWLYDQATLLTGNQSPVAVTVTTPNAANVLEGTPTPNTSADGVYRTQMGLDLQGRGAMVTVGPTTADSQWSLSRVTVVGIPNPAAQDDS